ncbi:hypothetical protein [Natronorarus salvus]|uniref:hypothetical protein n=1 Tax=Natronorarus salvus TaxID=3117733 RepID=UPI002F267A6E
MREERRRAVPAADYVLPSEHFDIVDSAVFWPHPVDESELTDLAHRASDHCMLWSELEPD